MTQLPADRRLFRISLYDNGDVRYEGRLPSHGEGGVAEALRIMAEAIDEGKLLLEPAAVRHESDDRPERDEENADRKGQRQDVEQAQDSDQDQDERDDQGDEVHD